MQATIEIAQKIVGPRFVNPLVDFKKPLEVIPRMIAKIRNIYPEFNEKSQKSKINSEARYDFIEKKIPKSKINSEA